MVPGPNCSRLPRPKHRRLDAWPWIGSLGRGDARRITQTRSPERPYAGRSRRPSPGVARRPAVTQTGSPRCPGVGEYSKGGTGVDVLPLLSTPRASVGAQSARRRRYGRRGQKPSDMRLMRGGHWRPTESVLSGTGFVVSCGRRAAKGTRGPRSEAAAGAAPNSAEAPGDSLPCSYSESPSDVRLTWSRWRRRPTVDFTSIVRPSYSTVSPVAGIRPSIW